VSTIVHIGFHKTATTWFQTSVYPMVQNARYVPRAVVREAFLDPTAFRFDPAAAAATLGREGDERLLLCEEGLSGYLHNGGLAGYLSKEMVFRLKAALPDARIVIVIRSQPSIIAAAYQQYVKGGGTYSVSRYLFPQHFLKGAASENPKAPRFTFDHFEYDRLIRLYREEFGPDRVHVYLYEELKRDSRAFLARMARDLDLDLPLERVSRRAVYRSYNWPALMVSRLFGLLTYRTVLDKHWVLHIPLLYPVLRALCEGISWMPFGRAPSPRALFGARLLRWVEHRYAESNRRLAAETGLPLAEFGYPMLVPNRVEEPPVRKVLPGWARI